jgi:hypothetical protein
MTTSINIEWFIDCLMECLETVLEEDLISSNKDEDGYLGNSEWTYLFSVVLYRSVRSWNQQHKPHLLIVPESNGGRTPSDFALQTRDKEAQIYIEHENDDAIQTIEKNLEDLLGVQKTQHRLLVCYLGRNGSVDQLESELKAVKKRVGRKVKTHVLVGKYEVDSKNGFSRIVI